MAFVDKAIFVMHVISVVDVHLEHLQVLV
ncbi:hypothetical protein Mgra_00007330 [Meloidogyne graminicola]|uniref:Uncharacterized protein n=1 Tax=Meloidogyne graminicola TaxID=189291 RepID=A0A8S9ZIS7_9BILA|nr:hypothetical protein Mgra_00007330 [Meloidogyne graminicola]